MAIFLFYQPNYFGPKYLIRHILKIFAGRMWPAGQTLLRPGLESHLREFPLQKVTIKTWAVSNIDDLAGSLNINFIYSAYQGFGQC